MDELRYQEVIKDGKVDYVQTYLAPWRSERNRVHRINDSVPRLRARLEKRLALGSQRPHLVVL